MDPKKNDNLTLDEMVFANRNKEYGAYFLRTNYSKYLTRALTVGTLLFGSLVVGAWGYNKYIVPNLAKEDLTSVEIDLDKLKQAQEEEAPPPPPPPPPPPEAPPPPPEVAQVKFLPPEPKPDEEVKVEEPPPPAEKVEKAVISNQTKEGAEVESNFTPPPPPPAEVTQPAGLGEAEEEKVFTTVEQNPEFPGGTSALYKFLGENMSYPAAAQRANVQGKVFVKFVVERDGSISDVSVQKGIGFGCDEEAVRVVKSMPKWSPGRQNGRNVRVYFTLPITFRLE